LSATQYDRRHFGFNISDYEQIYAAEISFDRIDYIPYKNQGTNEIISYMVFYRYKFEVQHVWKGNPNAVEYQFQCGLSGWTDKSLRMSDSLWSEIIKRSRKSSEIYLIFVKSTKLSDSVNRCAHILNYAKNFTHRIQLGAPNKSYASEYEPITPEDMLVYIRRYEYSSDKSFNGIVDYNVLNAINALKLLNAQRTLFDYLRGERFMTCEIDSISLALMSEFIRNIPEYFASLYSRFRPLLSCADTMLRIKMFFALAAIADRQTLNDMIEQVLQDDSAVVKRSAAYSTYAAAITYAEREAMMSRMLSSDNADERMFAAMMMKRSVYWSHPDKMRTLCQAEPAAWHYDDATESDSIAQICQDLLQTLSESSRESSETQALLDEFYSG